MSYTKDYYQILGVMHSAEDIVIRAAYKALAQRYHPDKYQGDPTKAKSIMQEIVEAYSILSDTDKRKKYDVWLSQQASGSEYQPDDQDDELSEAIASYDKDWKIACSIYPDLQEHYFWLNKVAHRLGVTYKIFLLESKAFGDRKVISKLMEDDFFKSYFGENADILTFAKSLVREGKKAAARSLNNYIRVVGQAVDSHRVIDAVCDEHGIENPRRIKEEAWEQSRQEWIRKSLEEKNNLVIKEQSPDSIDKKSKPKPFGFDLLAYEQVCPHCGYNGTVYYRKASKFPAWVWLVVGIVSLPFGVGIIALIISAYGFLKRGTCSCPQCENWWNLRGIS